MSRIANAVRLSLNLGDKKQISIPVFDDKFLLTAKKSNTGRITVDLESIEQFPVGNRADAIHFSFENPPIATSKMADPQIVTSGSRAFYLDRIQVDYDPEVDGDGLEAVFGELIDAAKSHGWKEGDLNQLELISLRASFPNANRPVSSLFRTSSIGVDTDKGILVVRKSEDAGVEIALRGHPNSNGERIVQTFSADEGFHVEVETPLRFNRTRHTPVGNIEDLHEALSHSMRSVINEMLSRKCWSEVAIGDFLKTCQELDAQIGHLKPLVLSQSGRTLPQPIFHSAGR